MKIVVKSDTSFQRKILEVILSNSSDYYIALQTSSSYEQIYYRIAKAISVPARDYYNILMQNNAFPTDDNCYAFQYKEDAIKALSEIEAYLTMNKLCDKIGEK